MDCIANPGWARPWRGLLLTASSRCSGIILILKRLMGPNRARHLLGCLVLFDLLMPPLETFACTNCVHHLGHTTSILTFCHSLFLFT
ncbi:hypothetical protein BJX62DRAFT_164859 [Aspergillus germanicus]